MKKFALTLCVGALVAAYLVSPALALPPFNMTWKAKYVEGNSDGKFVAAAGTAKCNVCHDPKSMSKKDKNEYGKAVGKYLSKADFEKVKSNADAAKKYIMDGLAKAEAEKAADGKTYGEKIKAGALPSGG